MKSNLITLKTEIERLDTDKLTPVPNDLAKLNNVVKSDVVKKTQYNKLVTKFVSRTKYENDGSDLEKKIKISKINARLARADLVTKKDFDAKLKSISDKYISNISTHLLVKNELKKFLKKLMLPILEAKIIFMVMTAHKTI